MGLLQVVLFSVARGELNAGGHSVTTSLYCTAIATLTALAQTSWPLASTDSVIGRIRTTSRRLQYQSLTYSPSPVHPWDSQTRSYPSVLSRCCTEALRFSRLECFLSRSAALCVPHGIDVLKRDKRPGRPTEARRRFLSPLLFAP